MQPSEETKFDKLQMSFFNSEAVAKLTPKDLEIRKRYQNMFVIWLDNPWWSDKEMVRYLRDNFNLSRSQAYEDISKVKLILGNVQNAAKEWQRYSVIEMLKKAYAQAEAAGDYKAMVMASDKLGKYTKLDKDEAEALPWDQLIPPQLIPTSDVSVLGITREKDFEKKVERLKKKYYQENNIEEADVVD